MASRGKHLVALALKQRASEMNVNKGVTDQNNNEEQATVELSDYDDDLRDPDFVPPKRQKRTCRVVNRIIHNVAQKSETVATASNPLPVSLFCDETPTSDSSICSDHSDDGNEHEEAYSSEDNTMPSKTMDPNQLFGNPPHNYNGPSTSQNSELTVEAQQEVVDHEEVIEAVIDETEQLRNKIEKSTNVTKLKNKRFRMTGLKYKGVKKDDQGKKHFSENRNERILTESKCSNRCKKKEGGRRCMEIDKATRTTIFKLFWQNMDWKQKKVYVINHVEKCEVKRRTTEESRRKLSYKYFLKVNEERMIVCREMFLSTLGLNEKMVYKWVQAYESGVPKDVDLEGLPDTSGRGGRTSVAMEYARQYLNDLPKLPSHYCRASTSKLYLEPLFVTLRDVHTEYTRKLGEESKPVLKMTQFVKLFHDMNLSLYSPKKDLCDICCGHDAQTVSDADYTEHIKRKEEARESKDRDKERTKTEKNVKVLTVDLQSLLICPKLNATSIYYKMKLSCHNYTIFDLATRKVMCYFWHECDGEMTANVFTSCIMDYLSIGDLRGINHVIIYSDGCGYQNRNVTLSNALLQFACDHKITIEQKILERGHTQMECDSVHSVIERCVKKQPIYIPQQYVEKIQGARKGVPYDVKYVDYTFFNDYSKSGKYSSIRPGTVVGSITVSDIRSLKYTDEGVIMYKTTHSSEYKELPEPRKPSANGNGAIGKLYSGPLPLKRTKFHHLQQLKEVIPKDYHTFYDNLPHC